jgi:predicted DNA-binding protein
MRRIDGRKVTIIIPEDLIKRMDDQAKNENRSQAEFIRRVLDRYLREVEFRGELSPEAEESIQKNKELLRLLRNA